MKWIQAGRRHRAVSENLLLCPSKSASASKVSRALFCYECCLCRCIGKFPPFKRSRRRALLLLNFPYKFSTFINYSSLRNTRVSQLEKSRPATAWFSQHVSYAHYKLSTSFLHHPYLVVDFSSTRSSMNGHQSTSRDLKGPTSTPAHSALSL